MVNSAGPSEMLTFGEGRLVPKSLLKKSSKRWEKGRNATPVLRFLDGLVISPYMCVFVPCGFDPFYKLDASSEMDYQRRKNCSFGSKHQKRLP